MDVLICSLNSQYVHSSLASWYLLAGLRKYGKEEITACVYENTINFDRIKIISDIVQKNPKIIGFSCYIWNIEAVIEIAKKVKTALPESILIFGGPEVSYNAREVFEKCEYVNFIISGEGEKPFALLCNEILFGNIDAHICEIPGLCTRLGDAFQISEPCVETDEPPCPYSEEYLKNLNGRIAYIESSRGCPFSCAYCLSGRCGGVRFFDIEKTKENILLLASSGTRTIKFVDRTFNANRSRAKKIWSFIKEEYGKKIPESVCIHFEIGADLLGEEELEILESMPAGAIQLEIGIQSFNEKTLLAVNRKTNTQKLYSNIQKLVSFGNMHLHIDLIAGLPHEDFSTFRNSFNKAFSLRSHMLQLGFLKLLHGSDMREKSEIYPCDFSDIAPYEVSSTPWLSKENLQKLKLVELANDKIFNSGRFEYSSKYILEKLRLTPFDILLDFGEYLKNTNLPKKSLFDFSKLYFDYFSSFPEIDASELCDNMVCDFFSHSRYGKLPPFLKRKDENIKKILSYLSENENTKQKKNTSRAVCVLYSKKCVLYCDSPCEKEHDGNFTDRLSGKYRLFFIPFKELPFDIIK